MKRLPSKTIKQIYSDVLNTLDTPLILSYDIPQDPPKPEISKKKVIKKLAKEEHLPTKEPKLPDYSHNKLSLYHAFISDKKKEIATENPTLSKAEALALARKAYKELKNI